MSDNTQEVQVILGVGNNQVVYAVETAMDGDNRQEVMVALGTFEHRVVHSTKSRPQIGWIQYEGRKQKVYVGFWGDCPVWKLADGEDDEEYVYCAQKTVPIEDDLDYCEQEVDMEDVRPTIVCLCGSSRFSIAFHEANLKETLAGKIVLSIGCDFKSDTDLLLAGELTQADKERLDELHLRKIDLADEVLILNVGGYVGKSTKREIAYALEQGKRIRWLEGENEVEDDSITA